ncbi:ABC transporter [Podospora didyma]|uniref:ABC transporter n=1 Tax=Podospora didyma TaxID=330526 RepID=A0AAE0N3A7_9PEZI|nr:ABC transporter [Podospora didyma]
MGVCTDGVAFGFASNCADSSFTATEYEWLFWLSIVISCAFAVLAIPRAVDLARRPSITRAPAGLLVAKLLVAAAYIGLRAGLLHEAVRKTHTLRLLASMAVEFAASCLVLALSPLEHFKSKRPSILLCLFLFLTLLCDVTRNSSLWETEGHATFTELSTAAIVVELVFLALESVRRGRWVVWNAVDHSPEETSSILSLGLYSWLSPLLWRGYHNHLTMGHLFALDKGISVEVFDGKLPSQESAGSSTWDLFVWLAHAQPLVQAVLLPIFPRLCLLGFTFCQPFFLERLLSFLASHNDGDSSTPSGLVAVAIFTYSGIAISTALYWYYQERFQSLLRAFLISSIYTKTASVPHIGDGDPAAVTLMGADVERVYTGLRFIHEVWANTIQIALASWLLQRQLGLAFLAPLVIVLFGFVISFVLSRRAVPYQAAWMARVQARTGITAAVLGRIKDLRVSGMTTPAADLVQHEREDEIRVGERSRVLVAVSASMSQLPQAVAPALAFAFGPHVLNETRAFTALSYLALLTAPLTIVLQSLPILSACLACLRRIRMFLLKNDREDGRLLGPPESEKAEKPDAAIVVQNGTFGWTADTSVLNDINLSLRKASVTFVVGPVASGKSTFCRVLLGEVPHRQGSVALGSSKLAYCDQSPFLFNASVMENIIGFSSFDGARYNEVVQATMLTVDLQNLPAGDQTIIGTKGTSLSGGQRQRVSLARALYHDAEILVLDDVFSGLDGATQSQVCSVVFGPDGLLRKRGVTAIVCTHSTHFLSAADYIVALSASGSIMDQGSYADIVRDNERAERLGLVVASGVDGALVCEEQGLYMDEITPATDSKGEPSKMKAKPTDSTAVPRPSPTPAPPPVPSPTVDTAVYRHWLSTIGLFPLVLFAILVAGNGFFSNFPAIWVRLWSADSTSANPSHSFAYWIGIYALLGACVVLCVFPAGLIMLRTAVRSAGRDLHRAALDTAMHSSLRFLGTTDVGKILNLFSQDMNIMDTQLPRMVNNLSFCLANAVGQAVVIALSSAWLVVSYPFFAAMLWVVQRVYLPTSKRLRILDLEAKTPLYTSFLDTLAGLPTIRAFGWFPHQQARNNALLDDSQRPSYLLAMAQQWLMLTMNVLVTIIAVLLVALATQLGSNAGSVGAALVTLITLGSTLTTIVVAYTGLETSLGAIGRLKAFGEETESEDQFTGDGEAAPPTVPGKEWPVSGRIQMQDVEASYDGTEKALKGVSLTINAGEKVAICGRTGSGKSTILSLLLRLIDPLPSCTPGILIEDTPINTISRTALRERIICASQDPVFLPDGTSLRQNLDPWSVAQDDECTATLAAAGLTSFTDLSAPLVRAEKQLSGGQKQLFSLARAVLRRRVKVRLTGVDGGLLLLDEITAAADLDTEARVRAVLEEEFAAWTVVMVTHRKEMAVGWCSRAVVVDAGRVVEDGVPEELMRREGGWFSVLWTGGGGS